MSYLQAALKVEAIGNSPDKEVCATIQEQPGNVTPSPLPTTATLTTFKEQTEPKEIKPFPVGWSKRYNETTLERLAIMTVDGGLTDQEAIEAVEAKPETIWSNPFPKGTPEARQATIAAIREAKQKG